MKTKTSFPTNSMSRSPFRHGLFLTALVLVCLAFSPQARATCQEGCLANSNTVLGDDALLNNTGIHNTAIGFNALITSTMASYNTAIGFNALFGDTTGSSNVASGDYALFSNTTGDLNMASGDAALYSNTTGSNNTACGTAALFLNTTANGNTAIGDNALFNNTIGNGNTATGELALLYNRTGNDNTANGVEALAGNRTGNGNTASGVSALLGNTIGSGNTATGVNALLNNTTGNTNTGDGTSALESNTTGHNNIALGHSAGANLTTGNSNIDIGNPGVAGEAKTIRIGATQNATFIAGINGATVPTGIGVIVDADGHLGTTTSSARFKEAIKPMDQASDAILALKPVTFQYKHELDPNSTPQFGLIAEDVEKVSPDLVARDKDGKPYTVRYEAVNAMLLNEFLKEHRVVQDQGATIVHLQKQIEALTAGLQKVSVQLELTKSTPQTIVRDH